MAKPVEGASRVLTVEPGDPCWRGSHEEAAALRRLEWDKAFVRVRPPAGTGDELVDAVRRAVVAQGAAAVRVMPRGRAVVAAAKTASGRASIRTTVEVMVNEATTRDRDALRMVVMTALSEVGL